MYSPSTVFLTSLLATRTPSITGFSIASEGVQAALVANEVNKAQKMKKLRDEQKAKEGGDAGTCMFMLCVPVVLVCWRDDIMQSLL